MSGHHIVNGQFDIKFAQIEHLKGSVLALFITLRSIADAGV